MLTGSSSHILTVISKSETVILKTSACLSREERNRLLGHLQAGVSPTEVAKMFGTTRQTVYSISSKYLEEGTLKDRPKFSRLKPDRKRVGSPQRRTEASSTTPQQ